MRQYNMTFDLKTNLGNSDLYFTVQCHLSSFIFLLWKTFVLLAKRDSGELRCPVTALIRNKELNIVWPSEATFSSFFPLLINVVSNH